MFYVNSSEVPCLLRLVEQREERAPQSAKSLYERNCASCHGKDLGNPPHFPALVAISNKYNEAAINAVIRHGRGLMPGYASLGQEAISALTRYLTRGEDSALASAQAALSPLSLRYTIDGYNRLTPTGIQQ